MWFLEIKCLPVVVACIINPTPTPPMDRYFESQESCEKSLMVVARNWKPAINGAWSLSCIRWPGAPV